MVEIVFVLSGSLGHGEFEEFEYTAPRSGGRTAHVFVVVPEEIGVREDASAWCRALAPR
jgi:hypothetical protein